MSNIRQQEDKINKIFDLASKNFTYLEAVKKIEKILSKYPSLANEGIFCKLGFLYDHLAVFLPKKSTRKDKTRYEKRALFFYNQALKFNPKSVGAIWGVGRIFWHKKNKRALYYARKAANIAAKVNSEMFLMFMNIAVVYEDLGNIKRSEYWYKRVIDRLPNSFAPVYGLINLYYSNDFYNKKEKISKLLPVLIEIHKKEFKKNKDTKLAKQYSKKIREISDFIKYR